MFKINSKKIVFSLLVASLLASNAQGMIAQSAKLDVGERVANLIPAAMFAPIIYPLGKKTWELVQFARKDYRAAKGYWAYAGMTPATAILGHAAILLAITGISAVFGYQAVTGKRILPLP